MTAERLARWSGRLASLPTLALPTDYSRPTPEKTVDGCVSRVLDDKIARAVMRLSLFEEDEDEEAESAADASPTSASGVPSHPSAFQILLSAFVVLLHRYTSDTDLLLATSARTAVDPLLLRIKLEPQDSFWSLVRKIQFLEREAEEDAVPYDSLMEHIGKGREEGSGPLFRVRFFDATDRTQHDFLQSTSLTTDWTVYVTAEADTKQANGIHSSHETLPLPTLSMRLHYNSLLFSRTRIDQTLEQLSSIVAYFASHPLSSVGTVSLIPPAQKKLLPDPRADLDFCGWKGAITDIFSRNAASHPTKTCIVESYFPSTADSAVLLDPKAASKRVFTYQQIDEASNVLAHHLLASGVEREDVVTVYSTRSVDLVVTVMGVLKAGATFSVIGASCVFIFLVDAH